MKLAKGAAMKYVSEFEGISKQQNNSIAFVGHVGVGKTHLTIAIAN